MKPAQFSKNSLYLFAEVSKFRQKCIWITESKPFEVFMIGVILVNTILLASQNYEERINPEGKYIINTVITSSEAIFLIIFVVEFALRIISMGVFLFFFTRITLSQCFGMHSQFVMEPGSYLRDPYNWIDFIVVITSCFPFIPYLPSTSGIRALRMLRPLRSINSIPRVRTLVIALLRSLPNLINVVVFLLFMVILFSIIGVMLFMNSLEFRCRDTLEPEFEGAAWPVTSGANYLCGWKECPENSAICASAMDYGAAKDDLNIEEFDYGLSRFDNILWSLLVMLQIFSAEGWSHILYIYWDKVNPPVSSIYFVVVLFFGCFFLLNLILAVISDSFERAQLSVLHEQKEKEQEKQRKKLKEKRHEQLTASQPVPSEIKDQPIPSEISEQPSPTLNQNESISEFSPGLHPSCSLPGPSRFSNKINQFGSEKKLQDSQPDLKTEKALLNQIRSEEPLNSGREDDAIDSTRGKSPIDSARDEEAFNSERGDLGVNSSTRNKSTFKEEIIKNLSCQYISSIFKSTMERLVKIEDKAIPQRAKSKKFYYFSYRVVFSPIFTFFSLGFIAYNSVVLALDRYPSGSSLQVLIFFSSSLCNLFFAIEMLFKILALGPRDFIRDSKSLCLDYFPSFSLFFCVLCWSVVSPN